MTRPAVDRFLSVGGGRPAFVRAGRSISITVAFLVSIGCGSLRAQTPADSAARLPGAALERDTTPLLSPTRIASFPSAEREAWTRYVEASRQDRARDRALIAEELRMIAQEKMTRAPYASRAFEVDRSMTEEWFRGDSARRMAEAILTYQTPSGGWSKRVDFSAARRPGQSFYSESDGWSYIATLDNNATTEQMRFLALAFRATGDARFRHGFLRGLGYLLRAQYPNGCWPQVYPLQGGYHDAATYNDDAIVHAAELLRDVMRGDGFDFVPADDRRRAEAGLARAVDCILASQVTVAGKRTIWGQQHDPLTLAPVKARSYEPASLASKESAGVVRFLMSLPEPDARVVEAVHAAAAWFTANRIFGYAYDFRTGRTERPGAGPLWARLYEIGTNRPVFSNRDGVILYDYERLTDRRTGYGWYAEEPASALRAYERWAARHPAPAGR